MRLFNTQNAEGVEVANCTTLKVDPEIFFEAKHEADAKALCGWCPLRNQCLEFAITEDMHYGIWGGLTFDEREKLRKTKRTKSRQGRPNKKY